MFKIGDKVKMTKEGFNFYSNVDIAFETHSVAKSMNNRHFSKAVCELFAIHGIGTVKKILDDDVFYIRWDFKLDGVNYHYCHNFEAKDVKKLSFLDKLIFKIQGRI